MPYFYCIGLYKNILKILNREGIVVHEMDIEGHVRVCGLRLGPNFVVRRAADKNFYSWITDEKIHAFAVFSDKYLRPCGFSDTVFTATVNCSNPKSQILNKLLKYM